MRASVSYLCVAALGLMGLGATGAYAQSSHHDHEPAPGRYARAMAAYTPPDVALVDQHGAVVSLPPETWPGRSSTCFFRRASPRASRSWP